jgi:hypothetical protein
MKNEIDDVQTTAVVIAIVCLPRLHHEAPYAGDLHTV